MVRCLLEARQKKKAIAAFNAFNQQTVRGIIDGANAAGQPVIIQPSTGTVKRLGAKQWKAMFDAERLRAQVPVILHLDHCEDEAIAKACVDLGWDAVMMDFSSRSLEENIAKTKEMVEYAHAQGVAVEGEVGVIMGTEDDISHDEAKPANFEDTVPYVKESGVDLVAPSVGTAHGPYYKEPKLNFQLVKELREALSQPLVLHGGTGLAPEAFSEMVDCGIAKINISTALKIAYYETLKSYLPQHNVSKPMNVDVAVEKATAALAQEMITLFVGRD